MNRLDLSGGCPGVGFLDTGVVHAKPDVGHGRGHRRGYAEFELPVGHVVADYEGWPVIRKFGPDNGAVVVPVDVSLSAPGMGLSLVR